MPRIKDVAPMCDVRLKLSTEVTNAVQNSYAARAAHARGKNKSEIAALAGKLTAARTSELAAVASLDKHRKNHGC